MSFYRVSVLDHDDNVAHSRTATTLADTAALVYALGLSTSEPWAEPLLDEYGEFTVAIRGEGGRLLLDGEKERLTELLEELGVLHPETDEQIDLVRWHNPERQT